MMNQTISSFQNHEIGLKKSWRLLEGYSHVEKDSHTFGQLTLLHSSFTKDLERV